MTSAHRQRSLAALGWGLVAVWAWWWWWNYSADCLIGQTWILTWPTLGIDFSSNFLAVHLAAGGENPYRQAVDVRGFYGYPPLVLGLFFWCVLFPLGKFKTAAVCWSLAAATLTGLATRLAWLQRRALGLSAIPWPLALGAVLLSTPVVFAMERGNCDALVLILLAGAATAIRRKAKWADGLAGACLAVAMWIKIYPGLVVLSALALRRWRVAAWGIIFGLVIPLLPLSATIQFLQAGRQSEGYRLEFFSSAIHLRQDPAKAHSSGLNDYPPLEAYSHSLPIYWRAFWTRIGLGGIAAVPGMVGAGIILGPLLAWAFWRVAAVADATAIAYPYFLFVALLATFWMPVSYDYNLLYLPVLAVAVWDARDPWPVQLLLTPFLIYWQPWNLRVPMELLLLFKLMALAGLAICLTRRAGRVAA